MVVIECAARKTREGADHAGRDAQFVHIGAPVRQAMVERQPVISVDTKRTELAGDFKNNGREWRPQGDPEEVRVHDFLTTDPGRAVPYGIYDLAGNGGSASVGISHDSATFAVQTIRSRWYEMGAARYPDARRLTITADGGSSSGSRVRLWKYELQQLADELAIEITVHLFPPGTSKWNKIGHRLFSFNSRTGEPGRWSVIALASISSAPPPPPPPPRQGSWYVVNSTKTAARQVSRCLTRRCLRSTSTR